MRTSLLALFAAFVASPASAALLLYDGFDYPTPGSLSGNTNVAASQTWTTSSTGGVPPTITGGSLSYAGLPASTGNSVLHSRTATGLSRINLPGGPYASGSMYYSLIISLNDIAAISGTASAAGSFLAGFNNGTGTDSTGQALDQAGQLTIRRLPLSPSGASTTRFQLGVGKNNGGTSTRVWAPQDFGVGDVILAVVSYEFVAGGDSNDVAQLWLNPVPGAAMPAASATATAGFDIAAPGAGFSDRPTQMDLRSFYVRNNSVQSGNARVDELRIGTTFADVTPPIPEPATLGLFACGAALVVAARRRCGGGR